VFFSNSGAPCFVTLLESSTLLFHTDKVLCVNTVTMRQKDKKQTKAGVYMIICLLLGIAYIGGSARLFERLQDHLDLLRLNRHHNKQLQRDWNTFGDDCFAIVVLETLNHTSQVPVRERRWTRRSEIEGKVYNQQNAVTERHKTEYLCHRPKWPKEQPARSAKQYVFIAPDGTEFKVRGLRGICSAYGLNPSHLSKVLRGVYNQHRGWTTKLEKEI
jgi:GIY-YIG catalytic domain